MKTQRLSRISGAVILALGLTTSSMATETSSAIRGKIIGPQGNAASNVVIKVVHEPTGTISTFTTNDSGVFVAKGLRVGGPYKVLVDSDIHNDAELENIFLSLGDTYRLNAQLEAQDIETIQVTGTRFLQDVGGSSSVFNADTIGNTPSFNRDIKDIARLNPLASINGGGELTIAGGNPRTNSLTVDGIGQNDDFGLNFGGYPTEQPPVALDAIEQISVDVSPFSAKKGNFGGGTINAVTKSGTNEVKFSGYYETSTPSMAGDVKNISQVFENGRAVLDENGHRTFEVKEVAPIVTENRFGLSVGGPIIEDKLFYFVNYASWSKELEMDYGFAGSGATHEYTSASEEGFQQFLDILDNTYGFQDSLGGDPKDTNETLLAKLSWNINNDHRLDFTYQWQDDQDERNFGTGGSTVMLNSARYTYVTKFNNFSSKLYSDWSSDFTTELGISYKDVSSESDTNSDFGSVKVEEFFRGPAYQFGTDIYRHANSSETENFTLSLDATYLLDEHEINFGAQYERLRLYNLFAENSLGSWEFDNFWGFENREVGNFRGRYDFTYGNAYTNNSDDTAYDAVRSQISVYVEDKFYLTDDIEVVAGVRYERLSSDDKPVLNQAFVDTYDFSNQENLDGLDIILPRVNLTWFAAEDLIVRAGIGRFQGGIPNVWYNNPFQKDGITLVSAPSQVINDYYANNPADITSIPQEIQNSLTQGAGSTNYTDPNFELPSSWRAQVGFDYTLDIPYLGEGFKWQSELMYHKKENEAVWQNTSLRPVGVAADGERVINESIYSGDLSDNFDIMMTNAKKDGRSVIFSTALAKEWDNGISMTMSYAHQDVTENHVGSSSRAQSNYKHNIIKNRNEELVARGHYEVEHSLKLTLGYETEFFEGYQTRFNMYFERRSGRPYSTVMGMYRDDDLGDTYDFESNSAYLAYIPSGADDPNVNWDESDLSWQELSVLLDQAGISPSGSIINRNTGTQPWVTKMDISIKQEIPGFVDGHKGQIFFMVDNFANLLNDDWGIEKRLNYPNQAIYDFGGLDSEGRYIIDPRFNGADTRNYNGITSSSSSWQAKIGINYKF
ncbi:TonB-dependent receptor [Thalassotalea sp. G2M2-11]|uniref:TonB-dependent receptor n=1 Tax=Thalassotalea sp. G2M2-11 TaxID=2787627 RepID=UPI0019D2AF5E|nr:TonB-dependent receptor [Thalassotalea sp. G2M2-11]